MPLPKTQQTRITPVAKGYHCASRYGISVVTLVTTQRFRCTSPQDVGLFAHMSCTLYPLSRFALLNIFKLAAAIHSPNSPSAYFVVGFKLFMPAIAVLSLECPLDIHPAGSFVHPFGVCSIHQKFYKLKRTFFNFFYHKKPLLYSNSTLLYTQYTYALLNKYIKHFTFIFIYINLITIQQVGKKRDY